MIKEKMGVIYKFVGFILFLDEAIIYNSNRAYSKSLINGGLV